MSSVEGIEAELVEGRQGLWRESLVLDYDPHATKIFTTKNVKYFVTGIVELEAGGDEESIRRAIAIVINNNNSCGHEYGMQDFEFVKRIGHTFRVPDVAPGFKFSVDAVKTLIGQGDIYLRMTSPTSELAVYDSDDEILSTSTLKSEVDNLSGGISSSSAPSCSSGRSTASISSSRSTTSRLSLNRRSTSLGSSSTSCSTTSGRRSTSSSSNSTASSRRSTASLIPSRTSCSQRSTTSHSNSTSSNSSRRSTTVASDSSNIGSAPSTSTSSSSSKCVDGTTPSTSHGNQNCIDLTTDSDSSVSPIRKKAKSDTDYIQDLFPGTSRSDIAILHHLVGSDTNTIIDILIGNVNHAELLETVSQCVLVGEPARIVLRNMENVASDAFAYYKKADMDRPIYIVYEDMPAVDAGGPKRQFFTDVLTDLRDNHALFEGPKNKLMPVYSTGTFAAGLFKVLGKVIVHSILQEGPGFPFFSTSIFRRICNCSLEDCMECVQLSDMSPPFVAMMRKVSFLGGQQGDGNNVRLWVKLSQVVIF